MKKVDSVLHFVQEVDDSKPRPLPRVAKQPQEPEEKAAAPTLKVKPFTAVVRMQRPEVLSQNSTDWSKYVMS